MQSKNKPSMTVAEHKHVDRIREMRCACCDADGPSEAHEIEQGLWWLSIPLCADCHRGAFSGLHGQKRAWSVRKKTEMSCLAETIRCLIYE